ncbi:MAG: MFS transporter [bacterium]
MPKETRESLEYCWKEGVVAQVMISIIDYYLIPYGLFIGASVQQIGLLIAIPSFLSSISQFLAVKAVQLAGDRRRLLIYGIGIQASLLIPLTFLPLVISSINAKIVILIFLISLFKFIGSIIGPAWGSLVSDYLPEGQRGQYLGWRSRVVGIAGIIGIAFWGSLLFFIKKINPTLGFILLFAGATIFRFASLYYMTKMNDVHFDCSPENNFNFWMFIRRFKESNFVKFTFYVSGITFATQLAAPYFSVYMLQNLHFNYLTYTAILLSSTIIGLVTFPIWGRNIDSIGSVKIVKSTSLLIPVVPLLWIISKNPIYLFLIELFSGTVWSGFNLSASNFIYDAVSAPKRVRCLGYFNLINGIAIFLGATLGGFLVKYLPPLFGYPLLTLFLISAIFRFFAHQLLSKYFKEVRTSIQDVSSTQLFFSVVGIRPIIGRNTEWGVYPPIK